MEAVRWFVANPDDQSAISGHGGRREIAKLSSEHTLSIVKKNERKKNTKGINFMLCVLSPKI